VGAGLVSRALRPGALVERLTDGLSNAERGLITHRVANEI
jgi:hypothetical protein